jgi:hypothetical protein
VYLQSLSSLPSFEKWGGESLLSTFARGAGELITGSRVQTQLSFKAVLSSMHSQRQKNLLQRAEEELQKIRA